MPHQPMWAVGGTANVYGRGASRENDPVKHNRASVTLPGYAGNVVSRDHRR